MTPKPCGKVSTHESILTINTFIMRWQVVVAGKPALGYAKAGVEEYGQRLLRLLDWKLIVVKAGKPAEVAERMLDQAKGSFKVVMDERGERWTTRQWTDAAANWERRGDIKTVCFLIGAADGHDSRMREQADLVLSLSSLTLQHELALVVLLEQLYRVASWRQGSPYHREG